MNVGDDIELTINLTDYSGSAVDLYEGIVSILIGDFYEAWYYISNTVSGAASIVIPKSVSTTWPAGSFNIQLKATTASGEVIHSDISKVTIEYNLIKGDIIEINNIFPYSFPH